MACLNIYAFPMKILLEVLIPFVETYAKTAKYRMKGFQEV